jgi:hypothetical protein
MPFYNDNSIDSVVNMFKERLSTKDGPNIRHVGKSKNVQFEIPDLELPPIHFHCSYQESSPERHIIITPRNR